MSYVVSVNCHLSTTTESGEQIHGEQARGKRDASERERLTKECVEKVYWYRDKLQHLLSNR